MDFLREANRQEDSRFDQESGAIADKVTNAMEATQQRALDKAQQLLDTKFFENNREFERARQLHGELADLGFTLPQLKTGYTAVAGGVKRLRAKIRGTPAETADPKEAVDPEETVDLGVERSGGGMGAPVEAVVDHTPQPVQGFGVEPEELAPGDAAAAEGAAAETGVMRSFKKTAGAIAEKYAPGVADTIGAGAVGVGGYEVGRELGLNKGGSAALAVGEGVAAMVLPEALPFIAAGDAAASFLHDLFHHHKKDKAPQAAQVKPPPLPITPFQTGDVAIPVSSTMA